MAWCIAHIAGSLRWYARPIAANMLYDAVVGYSVSAVRLGGCVSSPGTNNIVFGIRWAFISWYKNSSISFFFDSSASFCGCGGGFGSVM